MRDIVRIESTGQNNDLAIFEGTIIKRQTKDHKSSSSQRETIKSSRRQFLSQGGKVLAGSVLAGVALNRIHAGEDNTIRLALVGYRFYPASMRELS